jgi:hypothetical protein
MRKIDLKIEDRKYSCLPVEEGSVHVEASS